jgi:hypothetical protein
LARPIDRGGCGLTVAVGLERPFTHSFKELVMNSIRNLHRTLVVLGLPVAIALFSGRARAGTKSTQEVVLTGPDTSVYKAYTAQGSLGSARGSADGLQDIGCDMGIDFSSNPNQLNYSGGCWARNSAGTTVTCMIPPTWTSNWVAIAQTLATMGPTPYIMFRAQKDAFGDYYCSTVHVYSHADHMPPQQ